MPYSVVAVRGGFMVKKKDGEYMSSYPLTKAKAQAQMRAIMSSEARSSVKKKKGSDTKTTLKGKANRAY